MKAIFFIIIVAVSGCPLISAPVESPVVVNAFYDWLLSAGASNESLEEIAASDASLSAQISGSANPKTRTVKGMLLENRDYFLPEGATDRKNVIISSHFGFLRDGKAEDSRMYVLAFFPNKTGRADGYNEVLFPVDVRSGKIQLSEIRLGGMDGMLFDEILDIPLNSAQ